MSEHATIGVLMPCFNAETFIADACQSVLAQLNETDELVVQDGGSTDGTVELLRALAEEHLQLRLISEADSGQSDALNRALHRSTADYILWVNADDILNDGALDALRNVLRERRDTEPDFISGGHKVLRADGGVIATYLGQALTHRRLMERGCYVFSGSILIRRMLLLELGGFSERFHYCMDLDLLLRIADRSGAVSAHVAAPIGSLRWHDDSKSGGQGEKFLKEGWVVRGVHTRDNVDRLLRLVAFARQALALASVPIRHSRGYAVMRGVVR